MLFSLGLLSSISSTRYAATCVLSYPWVRMRTQLSSVVPKSCGCMMKREEHALRGPAAADRRIRLHENNLPHLLTSIHKSQLTHGTSPRNFVTLLQTCKAIYKVVANVMEGIFFQIENVTTDAQEASFPPQANGSRVGPTQKRFGAMVLFREAASHMIQTSTACTWMGLAMPNSRMGINSVIPRSEVRKVMTGERVQEH